MSGGSKPGMSQRPMSTKDKKKLEKEQAKAAAKKKKEAEARMKALKDAQKKGAKRTQKGMAPKKSPLARLFSFKGIAVTAIVGYLAVAQRELIISIGALLLKYPVLLVIWVGRTLVNVLVKPILLRLMFLKSSRTGRSDILPGGSY